MGAVNITLANGQLGGTLQTNDGICGMVLTAAPDGGGYALGTCLILHGMADVAAAGITVGDNRFVMKQLQEFYNEAGEGATLYFVGVANTLTVADMADNTNPAGAKALLDFANGKIKMLGIMSDDEEVTVPGVDGINDDCYNAMTNMVVMAAAYFAAQSPFRCIIEGTSYSGTASDLSDMTDGTTFNRVAILIGDTDAIVSRKHAALGLVLGRLSTLPVQRKLSRVRTGPMTNAHAYLGNTEIESTGGDLATITSLGYITWKTFPHLAGYYMNGDNTCTATTDDYRFLARGRVIDKGHALAYSVFVQEVDDEVPVNADGTIDSGFAKWLQQQIINTINTAMVGNKEVSGVDCFIDPAQNILATNTLNVVLKIRTVGYASDIEISLGFEA